MKLSYIPRQHGAIIIIIYIFVCYTIEKPRSSAIETDPFYFSKMPATAFAANPIILQYKFRFTINSCATSNIRENNVSRYFWVVM